MVMYQGTAKISKTLVLTYSSELGRSFSTAASREHLYSLASYIRTGRLSWVGRLASPTTFTSAAILYEFLLPAAATTLLSACLC
jgi:hypothetical protein